MLGLATAVHDSIDNHYGLHTHAQSSAHSEGQLLIFLHNHVITSTSQLYAMTSASLAARLGPLPFVKSCSRVDWERSGSLWGFCVTWVTLIWRPPPPLMSCSPQILLYILQICPSTISHATSDFDASIRESLESILGGPLSE